MKNENLFQENNSNRRTERQITENTQKMEVSSDAAVMEDKVRTNKEFMKWILVLLENLIFTDIIRDVPKILEMWGLFQ